MSALNFLRWSVVGGGAPPILKNPAPKRSILVSFVNISISAWSFSALLYATFINASFGPEILQYLIAVVILDGFAAVFFAGLARLRNGSDEEWSIKLLTIALVASLQYATVLWGGWLMYRMVISQVLVGTKMYFYFRMGKWMYNTIFGITLVNAFCILYTTYMALRNVVLDLCEQLHHYRKYVK